MATSSFEPGLSFYIEAQINKQIPWPRSQGYRIVSHHYVYELLLLELSDLYIEFPQLKNFTLALSFSRGFMLLQGLHEQMQVGQGFTILKAHDRKRPL